MDCRQGKAILVAALVALGGSSVVVAAPISGQGTWESTLQGRDLDGNAATFEAYYDTSLDITWLADANFAQTSGYDADGLMNWANANAWAEGLNIGGVTGWRLPTTVDVGNDGPTYTNLFQGVDYGYNITAHSEMTYMYYVTLGNLAFYDTSGTPTGCAPYCVSNTGLFSGVQPNFYWSSTATAADPDNAFEYYGNAWLVFYGTGRQVSFYSRNDGYAWAVHSGDVATVPEPAGILLLAGGLAGLFGVRRARSLKR